MTTYIVSYDLIEYKDYSSLIERIQSYGIWAKICESVWAISTNQSVTEIRDNFLSVMDNDDRIFVIKSGREAAWKKIICEDNWLKENL